MPDGSQLVIKVFQPQRGSFSHLWLLKLDRIYNRMPSDLAVVGSDLFSPAIWADAVKQKLKLIYDPRESCYLLRSSVNLQRNMALPLTPELRGFEPATSRGGDLTCCSSSFATQPRACACLCLCSDVNPRASASAICTHCVFPSSG